VKWALLNDTYKYVILYTSGVRIMRTHSVLDETLVEQARPLTGIKTKKALIHQCPTP
jgi:hypothetical protein